MEAFADTRLIDRHDRRPWLVRFLTVRPLRLLDIGGTWPTRAGASQALAAGDHPDRTQAWARAIHAELDVDGIRYPSSQRGHPGERRPPEIPLRLWGANVALFERAADALPPRPTLHLALDHPGLSTILGRVAAALRPRPRLTHPPRASALGWTPTMSTTPTDPTTPTESGGFLAPKPGSAPGDHCYRCGKPTPAGIAVCDTCNPGKVKGPSPTQLHATILGGVALGIIGLFILWRFMVDQGGPYTATIVTRTMGSDGSPAIMVTVANTGEPGRSRDLPRHPRRRPAPG